MVHVARRVMRPDHYLVPVDMCGAHHVGYLRPWHPAALYATRERTTYLPCTVLLREITAFCLETHQRKDLPFFAANPAAWIESHTLNLVWYSPLRAGWLLGWNSKSNESNIP